MGDGIHFGRPCSGVVTVTHYSYSLTYTYTLRRYDRRKFGQVPQTRFPLHRVHYAMRVCACTYKYYNGELTRSVQIYILASGLSRGRKLEDFFFLFFLGRNAGIYFRSKFSLSLAAAHLRSVEGKSRNRKEKKLDVSCYIRISANLNAN